MFHKNCCCFLSSTALFLTSQTAENLVVKKNKQLSFPQDIICRSHKPRIKVDCGLQCTVVLSLFLHSGALSLIITKFPPNAWDGVRRRPSKGLK